MREIKFCAWDSLNKSWNPIILIASNGAVYMSTSRQGDGEVEIRGPVKTDHLHIIQYTGLKDKNGIELREGDILKAVHFSVGSKKYYYRHVVRWRDKFMQWYCDSINAKDENDGCCPLYIHLKYNPEMEIIGNIYSNPELLKETDG